MSAPAPALSVVIPAYNEAARLAPTLERVLAFLERDGRPFEVVVVDDGSADGTAEEAARFAARGVRLLRQPANRGKGAALKRGVLSTRGERVLVTDADLSTPIGELARLEARLGDADVVLGSRATAESRITVRQPRPREWLGKSFNAAIRLLGVRGVRDTQCGFKLLDGEAARHLFGELTVARFAYDVELVWLARRRGWRVVEVGVEWADSADSRVRPLRDGLAMLRDVVLFRWRHWRRG